RPLGTAGRGWDIRPDEARDAGFVRRLLDRFEQERCVDRRRVFATGMSNGAFFASLLGCVAADRLAAVAPVAGGLDLRACAPVRPVPILFVYGRADRIVRAEMVHGARDWWARADGCGAAVERDGCTRYTACAADVIFCEGPQAHRWPAPPLDSIGELWFDTLTDYRERLYDSPEGAGIIARDVEGFIGGTAAYVTTEHVQRTPAAPPGLGRRAPGGKLFACLARAPGMTRAAFRAHWLERHVPLALRHHATTRY